MAYLVDSLARDVKIINNEAWDEIDFYVTLPHKISFTDAALIFLAGKMDAKLITFDKQLERIIKK